MTSKDKQKALTFGALIESGYRTCGKDRAIEMIRLAAKARVIVFRGPEPAVRRWPLCHAISER